MSFPKPETGLVISYSYLWSHEAKEGQIEGRKDRPCAILLLVQGANENAPIVTVAPITHSSPADPDVAVEIPRKVKEFLGLDSERSWVILDDFNIFKWPGFDLRPLPRGNDCYSYGLLPPALFMQIKDRFAALSGQDRINITPRDE